MAENRLFSKAQPGPVRTLLLRVSGGPGRNNDRNPGAGFIAQVRATNLREQLAGGWRRPVVEGRFVQEKAGHRWPSGRYVRIKCGSLQDDGNSERWCPTDGISVKMLTHSFAVSRFDDHIALRLQAESARRKAASEPSNGDHNDEPAPARMPDVQNLALFQEEHYRDLS